MNILDWLSENWNWIAFFFCSILIVCSLVWYKKWCSNHIDNIISGSPTKQIITLFAIVFFALFYFFLIASIIIKDGQDNVLLKVYSIFSQTSGVDNAPAPDYFKYFSLIVSFVGSIFFSGFLISTFNNAIQRRIESVGNGTVRYKSLKNHDVIIGANELLCPMIRYYAERNIKNRIVVLTNHNPQEIYSKLNELNESEKNRVIVYHGDISISDNLEAMRISQCNRIAILGDNDMTHCDSINSSLLYKIDKKLAKDSVAIKKECFYMYWNDSFIFNTNLNIENLTVHPFNLYEMIANKLWGYSHINKKLEGNKEFNYHQITKGKISPESNNYVNLIILGFNAMAIELLKTALKICHFANYNNHTRRNTTQITIISDNKKGIDKFRSIYDIEKISDIKCNFFLYSPYSQEERDKIEELLKPHNTISTIAICSDHSDENYVHSLHLPPISYNKDVDILVQYETYSEYIDIISSTQDEKRFHNIKFFGFTNSGLEIRRSFDVALLMNKCLTDLKQNGSDINKIYQLFNSEDKREIEDRRDKLNEEWDKLDPFKRRILLTYFDTIPSLFDSLDISLVEGKEAPDKSVFEKLEKHFESIKQRQFQALSVLICGLEKNKIIKDDWELSNMFYVKNKEGYEPGFLLQWFYDNKQFNKESKELENVPFYIANK